MNKQLPNKKGCSTRSGAIPQNRNRDFNKEVKPSRVRPSDNDASLYTVNDQLSKDVGTISFFQAIGSTVVARTSDSRVVEDVTVPKYKTVPGVLVLNWAPAVGRIDGYATGDDINAGMGKYLQTAAYGLFTRITAGNSRSIYYEPADVIMYILALDSLHSLITAGQRVYGLINHFAIENRYLPAALITATGFNYASIIDDIANFRARLNYYAKKVSTLVMPAYLKFAERHRILNAAVIAESETTTFKTQLYMPVMKYWFRFTDEYVSGTPNAGACELVKSESNTGAEFDGSMTADDYFNLLEELMARIIERQDFQVLSSDILKALGEESIYRIQQIPEDFTIIPSVLPDLLSQFKNADLLGAAMDISVDAHSESWNPEFGVFQKDGTVCAPQHYYVECSEEDGSFVASGLERAAMILNYTKNPILFSDKDNPSVDEVFEMSRLKLSYEFSHTSPESLQVAVISGSEICVSLGVFYFDQTGNQTSWNFHSTSATTSNIKALMLSQFEYAPIFTYARVYGPGNTVEWEYIGDIDNYAVVDKVWLKNIHSVALMSEFNFPLSGSIK